MRLEKCNDIFIHYKRYSLRIQNCECNVQLVFISAVLCMCVRCENRWQKMSAKNSAKMFAFEGNLWTKLLNDIFDCDLAAAIWPYWKINHNSIRNYDLLITILTLVCRFVCSPVIINSRVSRLLTLFYESFDHLKMRVMSDSNRADKIRKLKYWDKWPRIVS